MQITLEITTTEEDFKRCIAAAWEKAYDEQINPNDIYDHASHSKIPRTDIDNMLLGSCLGELVNKDNSVMTRTG